MLKAAGRYIKPRSSYVDGHARARCARSRPPQILNSSVCWLRCARGTRLPRWEDVKGRFEADPRYRAIDTAREREELFEDYLWEIKRADRELRRQQAAAFRQLLAESAWLTGRSRWVDEEVRACPAAREAG